LQVKPRNSLPAASATAVSGKQGAESPDPSRRHRHDGNTAMAAAAAEEPENFLCALARTKINCRPLCLRLVFLHTRLER